MKTLSSKNKFWIPRPRYYELKWFCLQYDGWKKALASIDISPNSTSLVDASTGQPCMDDDTAHKAMLLEYLSRRIQMVEQAVMKTAPELYSALMFGITKGAPYELVRIRTECPCGHELYYKKYREVFWHLDRMRQ